MLNSNAADPSTRVKLSVSARVRGVAALHLRPPPTSQGWPKTVSVHLCLDLL